SEAVVVWRRGNDLERRKYQRLSEKLVSDYLYFFFSLYISHRISLSLSHIFSYKQKRKKKVAEQGLGVREKEQQLAAGIIRVLKEFTETLSFVFSFSRDLSLSIISLYLCFYNSFSSSSSYFSYINFFFKNLA
ncbi:hypothetical protein TorRG33x02_348830, partial [Trema orientale]